MLYLGRKQELIITKMVDFGVYLSETGTKNEDTVLLPRKEVPADARLGNKLEVFLYKDSSDRLIATRRTPLVMLDGVAKLRVKEVSKIGAFLDWGLEKDLLLPYHEQTRRVRADQEVLCALYIDKSSRLCATMNVYPYLKTNSPYQIGDTVHGRVYEISDNFGVFVAVDDKYSGLIPQREAAGRYEIGSVLELRVSQVKEDGKLDLSARQKAYLQIEEDAENVLSVIDEFDGVLPFGEKVSPEIIRREFGLSKAAFKRAVGHLLKNGQIEIGENRIYRVK